MDVLRDDFVSAFKNDNKFELVVRLLSFHLSAEATYQNGKSEVWEKFVCWEMKLERKMAKSASSSSTATSQFQTVQLQDDNDDD